MKNFLILCAAIAILCSLPGCASSCHKTASCSSCPASKGAAQRKAQ